MNYDLPCAVKAFVPIHTDDEYRHANMPQGKGLGVGASVRALPEAGKERMSERSEFLAPSVNGFARIAPKTPALDLFLCYFLFVSRQKGK